MFGRGRSSDAVAPGEEALVAAARRARRQFAALYERYSVAVYRFCFLRLSDRQAAEDATSEVFLRAMRGLDGFRGGDFVAWLYAIARNVVASSYRSRKPQEQLDAATELADLSDGPEELAMLQAERAALRRAVESLPDAQRQVIELHLAGWSLRDSARAMGKTTDAVKMLRFRAVQGLRGSLESTQSYQEGVR